MHEGSIGYIYLELTMLVYLNHLGILVVLGWLVDLAIGCGS